jgi:hypothetical protein
MKMLIDFIKRPICIFFLLAFSVFSNWTQATENTSNSVTAYAQACSQYMAQVPSFSCLVDSAVVPITVNGEEPPEYVANMTCDKPALLPYGKHAQTDGKQGQCIPFSRMRKIELDDEFKTQISIGCRQKKIRSKDSVYFDEVDVIAHSVVNGQTCWFQAVAQEGTPGIDGSKVPSPNLNTQQAGYPNAKEFWNTPQQIVENKEQCTQCHDNDPFMYSPWVGQVWDHVPTDPIGFYANDVGPFGENINWTALTTDGNTCTGCHRIGSEFSCGQGLLEATGKRISKYADVAAHTFPLSHWMPPGEGHSFAQWSVIYQQSADDLNACCNDPSLAQCIKTPITGNPMGK